MPCLYHFWQKWKRSRFSIFHFWKNKKNVQSDPVMIHWFIIPWSALRRSMGPSIDHWSISIRPSVAPSSSLPSTSTTSTTIFLLLLLLLPLPHKLKLKLAKHKNILLLPPLSSSSSSSSSSFVTTMIWIFLFKYY